MRILKIFVVIVIVYISLVFPKVAFASENTDFGNTATLSKFINIFLPETALAEEKTADQEQPEVVVKEDPKTEEEIKNESNCVRLYLFVDAENIPKQ